MEDNESSVLTPEERDLLFAAALEENNARNRIFDLNAALETAHKDLLSATAQARGARAMLVATRGWKNGEISRDGKQLIRKA